MTLTMPKRLPYVYRRTWCPSASRTAYRTCARDAEAESTDEIAAARVTAPVMTLDHGVRISAAGRAMARELEIPRWAHMMLLVNQYCMRVFLLAWPASNSNTSPSLTSTPFTTGRGAANASSTTLVLW
jgi:hypothetical protein